MLPRETTVMITNQAVTARRGDRPRGPGPRCHSPEGQSRPADGGNVEGRRIDWKTKGSHSSSRSNSAGLRSWQIGPDRGARGVASRAAAPATATTRSATTPTRTGGSRYPAQASTGHARRRPGGETPSGRRRPHVQVRPNRRKQGRDRHERQRLDALPAQDDEDVSQRRTRAGLNGGRRGWGTIASSAGSKRVNTGQQKWEGPSSRQGDTRGRPQAAGRAGTRRRPSSP